jgi:peptide-methionine (R)-S-oxide reductase
MMPTRAWAGFALTLSDAEWRKRLSPAQYSVLRGKQTEYPYTSPC